VQVSIFHPVYGNVNIDHQANQLNFGRESRENTPNLQFFWIFSAYFNFCFEFVIKYLCKSAKNGIKTPDLNAGVFCLATQNTGTDQRADKHQAHL